jgi:hypothetical protein
MVRLNPAKQQSTKKDEDTKVFHLQSTETRSDVLLKTAVGSRNVLLDTNILFYEGAQRSFITSELAEKLNLQKDQENYICQLSEEKITKADI